MRLRGKRDADKLRRDSRSNHGFRPGRTSLQPNRSNGKVGSFGRHVRGHHTHGLQAVYQRRRIRYRVNVLLLLNVHRCCEKYTRLKGAERRQLVST